MASMDFNSGRTKNSSSFENLAGDVDLNFEEISWLIDNLPVTIFRTSSKLSWGIDYISKNVEKLTGYSRDDFVNQKLLWSDIVFPEDISIIDKAVQKAKKSKSPYQVEYRIKKSDGSTVSIQEQAHLAHDNKGNPTYIYGVFSDITSQTKRKGESTKVLKEEDRIQLELLRSFIKNTSTGNKLDKINGSFTGEAKKTADLINSSIENITGVLNETKAVSKAVEEGDLKIRANNSRYPGEWGIILKEMNSTLDSVIGPLNVAAEYVERISRGEVPEPITDNYKGDFNKIKNNLNNCIEGLQGLVECNNILQRMAVNDQTKGVEGQYVGIYASMGEATNLVRARVLNVTNVLENIAVGNTSRLEELKKIGRRSEQDRLMPAIVKAMENVSILIEDTEMLSRAAVEGKLDTRADVSRHQGEYRKIVQGINDTLDSVIGPLNVAAEYVERIGRGEIPEPITENYKGDFNEIKNNLNNCIEGLQGLVECNNILQRMAVNDQTKGVEGEYVGIYASMGEATNLVRARVLNVTKQLNNIAVGDSSELEGLKKIGKRSEQDQLLPAIIRAMENVKLLIEDTEMLSRAAIEGKLDTRADASRHQGEYRKIVEGINDTLDSVIGPLNVAAEYVERISRGDIPKPITDDYKGDFNEIKNNLNTCITAINRLIEDSLMLADAGVAGRLDTRADANRHEGDFRRIVTGVNNTLDSVIGPLNVAAEYVERISRGDIPEPITDNYNGDFNEIKNNLNTCITAVNRLIEDSLLLSEAAIEGRLDTRADATRHEGDFRKIVEGVNDTLDAVIGPLNVAAEYVERISRGDIPEPITDNYNGDFNEIKNNLNTCIEAVNSLVSDAGMLVDAAVRGKLDTRADASIHQGDFQKIVEGVNTTLNTLVGYIDRMPLPVMAIDTSYNILYMNETGSKVVGSTKKELIGKKCFSQFKTGDCQTQNCACARAMEKVAEITSQTQAKPMEKELEISYTGIPIKNQKGEVTGAFEFVQDQTASIKVANYLNNEVEKLGYNLDKLSNGNTDLHFEVSKADEYTLDAHKDFVTINEKLEKVNYTIKNLVTDAGMLSEAAVEGRLDTRADASKHPGDFRKIVGGVNDTLDAVIGPLNVAAEYVERISRGDIPEPITDDYKGDFNEIKNNLNTCIDGLQGLVECNNVLNRMAVNDNTKGVEGEYVGIYASMGEATNLVQARILNVTNQLNNIAVGDTSRLEELRKIGKRSEQDHLMPAIIKAMENVSILIEDTEMLSKAAVEGRLDTRADVSRHQGEYREIIQGINDTLDAVIGPLNVAAEYVERISRGDIPEPITDDYKGDFNEIKNNLNTCIEAVNRLIEDSLLLSEAAVEGRLDTRADATRHEGDFRKIVEGVNETLDAVIGPLNEAIRVSNEFSNGNFKARVDEKLRVEGDFVNFKDVLNKIGISVSEIIKSAKSVTIDVAEHSNEASTGADEVARAAGEVAMSSQKSSELTRELLYKIDSINREIIDLSQSNEKIADTSKGILSTAHEVVNIGKDAQVLGQDTNFKMQSVEKIAKESVDRINNLTEKIKEIDSVVQLINDITSQINLLSLNAAIEAARAGEHGRGFAVVAGEVKNLASKARNATETIENVVISVQKDSKKTADAINDANKEIIDGVNSVNRTLDSLNTIIKNATQVTKDIDDIAKAIEGQTKISAKVVIASEEGNAMTREVQRESEALAAVAEETSASIEEIGAAIHEVTNLAKNLRSDMEMYRV